MSEFDDLKQVLSADNKTGENMEYDALYLDLENLVKHDEDNAPDWRKLKKNCLELWKKTRDLRVASYLCVAETLINGFEGLANGLDLIHWLINECWEDLYPRLDPDDDNDPLERINILSLLSPEPGAFDDAVMLPSKIRLFKLMPNLKYTLRDVMILNGEIDGELDFDMNLVNAEIRSQPHGALKNQLDLINKIIDTLKLIENTIEEKIAGKYPLKMETLNKDIMRIKRLLDSQISLSDGEEINENEVQSMDASDDSAKVEQISSVQMNNISNIANAKIKTRADALLLLRKSMEYFQSEEPTSPVPYLLQRAMRVAEMNFMDLLQDIAPDALSRGRDVLGVKEE
ncbi:MAG: type VI secretion system protein TssA [Alphaproteobacteria bacterium]|nr:type VI secretion system protein TssA [Alphaproteobacteria bacterium]